MWAAKVQASLRIRAVSPEPPLLAHTSSESRGTFRQKARSLVHLNGRAYAVKICHDGMLEDTNSLDGAHLSSQPTPCIVSIQSLPCILCQTCYTSSTVVTLSSSCFNTIWATSCENVSSGICDQLRFKPAYSASEAILRLEILDIETRGIILSRQRTTKALIRLRGCAGWSAPLFFAYGIRHVFAWRGSFLKPFEPPHEIMVLIT